MNLQWDASPGATSYEYCYDTSDDDSCSVWTDNGTATSKSISGLSGSTTYYWQVRAVNGSGETYADSGSWWSFTTESGIKKVTLRSQAVNDGWVLESGEFTNKGGSLNAGSTTFLIGDDAQDRQYRSILSFRTAGLPDNAVITKVTLKIKKQGLVGTNPFNTHSGLKVDIRQSKFGTSARLQRTDFQAAASKNLVGNFNKTPKNNWYTVTLYSSAYPYVNLTGLTQFRLRFGKDDNNDNGADYLSFYSGNASYTLKPRLIIEYYVP
jgi:uncharacterized protein YaaQ